MTNYKGRFAPSPTGPLHAGSLVTALASWLDARAHQGQWLVRIEDVDTPRCVPGADRVILEQLASLGLHADSAPLYQSQRGTVYQSALEKLMGQMQTYPCLCSRQDVAQALASAGEKTSRNQERIYPGTCRHGIRLTSNREDPIPPMAWRFMIGPLFPLPGDAGMTKIDWIDRRLGPQHQNVSLAVGDFILKRSDGLWAYQLAVVVDDAEQGITHVVRGEDLLDNTARQILLQHALELSTPSYLHVPLVLSSSGEKLSKQTGAVALDTSEPLLALMQAGQTLGLAVQADTCAAWLDKAVSLWRERFLSGHCE